MGCVGGERAGGLEGVVNGFSVFMAGPGICILC